MDSDSAIQDNNLQDTVQDSEPGKTRMKDKTGKHSCMYFFSCLWATGDCKMYATEKQNRGSDCSLIVVSLTTENNRIIHIRKAVAFSDFTFLLQTFCNLL